MTTNNNELVKKEVNIDEMIYVIRGQQVMLDSDLAALYNVETKRLNENVKRNINRFPANFCFQITEEEFQTLRSQFATSKYNIRGGRRYLPFHLLNKVLQCSLQY